MRSSTYQLQTEIEIFQLMLEAKFNSDLHPRGKDGKFAKKEGNSDASNDNSEEKESNSEPEDTKNVDSNSKEAQGTKDTESDTKDKEAEDSKPVQKTEPQIKASLAKRLMDGVTTNLSKLSASGMEQLAKLQNHPQVKAIHETAKNALKTLGDAAVNAFNTVKSGINNAVAEVVKRIPQSVKDKASQIGNSIKDNADKAGKWAKDIGDKVKTSASDAITKAKKGTQALAAAGAGAVIGIFNGLIGMAEGASKAESDILENLSKVKLYKQGPSSENDRAFINISKEEIRVDFGMITEAFANARAFISDFVKDKQESQKIEKTMKKLESDLKDASAIDKNTPATAKTA